MDEVLVLVYDCEFSSFFPHQFFLPSFLDAKAKLGDPRDKDQPVLISAHQLSTGASHDLYAAIKITLNGNDAVGKWRWKPVIISPTHA